MRPEGGKSGGARSAEAPKGRRAVVYRLVDGAPKAVPVTLGLSDGRSTELVEGLSEGDKVVVGEAGAIISVPMPLRAMSRPSAILRAPVRKSLCAHFSVPVANSRHLMPPIEVVSPSTP